MKQEQSVKMGSTNTYNCIKEAFCWIEMNIYNPHTTFLGPRVLIKLHYVCGWMGIVINNIYMKKYIHEILIDVLSIICKQTHLFVMNFDPSATPYPMRTSSITKPRQPSWISLSLSSNQITPCKIYPFSYCGNQITSNLICSMHDDVILVLIGLYEINISYAN